MKPPVVVIGRHCNRNQCGIAVRFKKIRTVAKIAQSSERPTSQARADGERLGQMHASGLSAANELNPPAVSGMLLRRMNQPSPGISSPSSPSVVSNFEKHWRGSSRIGSAGPGADTGGARTPHHAGLECPKRPARTERRPGAFPHPLWPLFGLRAGAPRENRRFIDPRRHAFLTELRHLLAMVPGSPMDSGRGTSVGGGCHGQSPE